MVHNQSKSLENLSGGIYLAPGLETYVGVSRTFISKAPTPYSDCISDLIPFSDYSKTIFDYFYQAKSAYFFTDFVKVILNILFFLTAFDPGMKEIKYDQELCIRYCYQDKLLKNCSCASLVTTYMNVSRYCVTDIETHCENAFNSVYVSSNPDEFCENVCRPECESQQFAYMLSQSKFPTQDYINLHPGDKPLLRLIVNYKDSIYTEIIEAPAVTIELLLGNVGGQMDLFVGLSLLTFVEIFELIFEIIVSYFRIKMHKNKQQVNAD